MDVIDTLIAARIANPSGIVSGEVPVWNGTGWDRSSVTNIGTGSLSGYPWKNADIAPAAAIGISKLAITGAPTGSKFLRDDGSWQLPGSLKTYRKNTATAVNTTVAATDLLAGAITLAANDLSATGFMRISLIGDYLNNTGGTVAVPRFQLIVGGTTIFDTGVAGGSLVAASANRGPWSAQIECLAQNATNAQSWKLSVTTIGIVASTTRKADVFTTGEGAYSAPADSGVGFPLWIATGANTSALDMTASKTVVFNVINGSASASYETKLFGGLVEII